MAVVCKRENILETLEGCSSLVQDRLLNHITSYQHNLHRLQMNMNKDLEQSIVQILNNASVIKAENGYKHHHKIKELFQAQSCLLNDIYAKSNDMMMSCFKKAHFLHNQLHHKWYNTFIGNNSNDSDTTQMEIDSIIKTEPHDEVQNTNDIEYDFDEEREVKPELITPSNKITEQEQSDDAMEHANDRMNTIQDNNDNRIFRYKCSHCTERLESVSRFENHNWFEHKDTKPWKCSQCSDMFKTSCGLCCHIRSHNKESWFQCDQCDKSFPRKGTLNVHKRIHSNSGEKPFQCDVCGKKCRNIKKYKQHQKKCKKIHNEMMRIKCTKVNTLYSGIYYYYK
eukprot:882256_1